MSTAVPTPPRDIPVEAPTRLRPEVLLVDVGEDVELALRSAGFNVVPGSFGTVHLVDRSAQLLPVRANNSLPGYHEKDIVIVDLAGKKALETLGSSEAAEGVEQLWHSCASGRIDLRPLAMYGVRAKMDRILDNGGIFIVFTRPRQPVEYLRGTARGRSLLDQEVIRLHDWCFLSALEAIETSPDQGKDIRAVPDPLGQLIRRYLAGGEFHCTLSANRYDPANPYWIEKDCWAPLATNRFGGPVAGVLAPSSDGKRKGWIFLMPRLAEPAALLRDLLANHLPRLAPSIFPHLVEAKWVHSLKYEVPAVLKLRTQIDTVRLEADAEIAKLTAALEKEKVAHEDWYTLLSGTGDALVQSVIRTLRRFGFADVIDVDAESREESARSNQLREDIRIQDTSPILVIDVKGINGHPEDAEAQQAEKHTLMRSRDLKRTDLQALTIINAQRHLPPEERDLVAYRQALVENALQVGSGLMTTWDLCLILRNIDSLGWTSEDVRPMFYQTGRIAVLPAHYLPLGEVVKVWHHAIGVIPNRRLEVGDTVVSTPGDGTFREIPIQSLQVDGQFAAFGEAGSNCGIAVADSSGIKVGHAVFYRMR